MRLLRLDLTRYGKFTGARLDFGPPPLDGPDLHVVHGLNEAGKSTALAAWLDLLFGIDARSRYGFLHPYATMEIGGALAFGGGVHELRRVKRQTHSLIDAQDRPANESALAAALAGLTRESYAAMFSLDEATLEDGGEAILDSKGDLGALLFSASAGLAEANRALDALAADADLLHRKRASKTRVAELKRRVAELKSGREAIDVQASTYEKLVEARRLAAVDDEEASRALAQARARRDGLTRMLRARPLLDEHDRAAARLAGFAALPRPPAGWAVEQRGLLDDDLTLRNALDGIDRRAATLREEIARLAPDARILALGARVDDLAGLEARWVTAEEDLPKRRAALGEREARLAALLGALGVEAGGDPQALILPAPVVATLRDLIETRSGAEAAARAAAQELNDARAALDEARAERKRLAGDDDPARLATLRAALDRLRGDDLLARARQAERDASERRARAGEALAGLAPWTGEAAALARLEAPDARRIEGWRAAAGQLETRAATLREAARDLAGAQREEAARLAAARAATQGFDDARAAQARDAREAAWTRHRAALDEATAQTFETAMRGLDALDAARLAKADDVAQARLLSADAARRAARIARIEDDLAAARADAEALGAQIAAEAPIPLDAALPLAARLARLERWTKARDAALTLDGEARRAEATRATLAQEVAAARGALAAALAPFGLAAETLALDALAAAADAALAAAADRRVAREGADKALARAERDLATRDAAAKQAAEARTRWRASWARALAGHWFADLADDPAAVRALLDELADLPGELRERADVAQRIEAMTRDQAALAEQVGALFADLGEAAPASPREGAARLARRLAAARLDDERKRDRARDLDALAGERETVLAAQRLHDARKAERLTFFGVGDLLALDAALADCAQRDRLVADRQALAERVVAEIEAPSLDAARDLLARFDVEAGRREAAEHDARMGALEARARDAYARKAQCDAALAGVGGDAQAARLDAERRVALIELEETAQTWLRLRAGGLIAGHALRAWRETHRSAMMTRAAQAFRQITGGAYTGLATRVEKEREILIALCADGGSKLVGDLSKGTRFQLYLALRLAGYEEFAAARGPVPFVADDILETFDEPRSEQAFRLLARMARVGQVIYFTHHRHLCDIALRAAPGVRVHELNELGAEEQDLETRSLDGRASAAP